MTKAYRCDRCRECYDGVPEEELHIESANRTVQLCTECSEKLKVFLAEAKKEGEAQ